MSTQIKSTTQHLKATYFGIVFIQGFTWFLLLIIALLIEKGLDTIVSIHDFNEKNFYQLKLLPTANNITWILIGLAFLFINYLAYTLRYLIWSPWPIFSRIFDFKRIEKGDANSYNAGSTCLTINLQFNKILGNLVNITHVEVISSVIILIVEFIIVYMGILTIDKIQFLAIFMLIIPVVDFIVFYLILVIKQIYTKNNRHHIHYKGFREYFPREFSIANSIDFISIAIVICIFSIISHNNGSNFFQMPSQLQMDMLIVLSITIFITNLIVFRKLKLFYTNAAYLISNQSFLRDSLHSNYRPQAYKDGYCNFMGLNLDIDERVYPPTPETSFMVEKAIELTKAISTKPYIVDIGTGSGNIALRMAKEFPGSQQIIGLDNSNSAIELAERNKQKLGINNVEFYLADLIQRKDTEKAISRTPDLIIANLPYGSQKFLLHSNPKESLAFMPPEAVFPKTGIIGDYIDLIQQLINEKLSTTVFLETGPIPKQDFEKEFIEMTGKDINKIAEIHSFEHVVNPKDSKNYSFVKIVIKSK